MEIGQLKDDFVAKNIIVLGSTGSIGVQTLDICRRQNFSVVGLSGHSNTALLEAQIREFNPQIVAIANDKSYADLKKRVADLSVTLVSGAQGVLQVASTHGDIVVNAISGIAGLRPTLAALDAGNPLALANKEALVVGGELVMSKAANKGLDILPIDSEHSAIWQCLRAGQASEVGKVILTASGGPFFGKSREELKQVTLKETLNHPTWSMGRKITVDSATLMNKGLEVLEAMQLFQLSTKDIQVVVHPQSVLHSAVEYQDGSVIGQMGTPDMRVAIQYALTYPHRVPLKIEPFSFTKYGSLTFMEPDCDTFTCLASCIQAGNLGGFAPCIVNGANEQAVDLFLSEKITFLDIGRLVQLTLEEVKIIGDFTLEKLEEADTVAREYVLSQIAP